jgi:ribosomal protein S18 acetylase RimI-like enzyme
MNEQQLMSANIENLTQLWKRMGATTCSSDKTARLFLSNSWPHRCWFESKVNNKEPTMMAESIEQIKDHHILPVWLQPGTSTTGTQETLKKNGFDVVLEQTAMVLELQNDAKKESSDLKITEITSDRDSDIWTDIAARSFNYEIDPFVIREITGMPDVQLLQAYRHNHPAATALIFHTGNIVGVHQVGVVEKFRGQGIARKLMQHVINRCSSLSARYITLQASDSAKHLYKSLGFKSQFKIKNYQRGATFTN